MRQKLVVGNWKLYGSVASIQSLLTDLKNGAGKIKKTTLAVCPPYLYIPLVQTLLKDTSIQFGAQDCSDQENGAYTGEVSAVMLKEYGCTYVILGHSERRHVYHESDMYVAKKFGVAQKAGLLPILCVGEKIEERDRGNTESVIARQLDAVLSQVAIQSFTQAIIAYEPVWAIGTGKTATPQQAQDVHKFIREKLSALDAHIGKSIQILYGGSVKPDNARDLFSMPDIDGGLIGGASLKAADFLSISAAA